MSSRQGYPSSDPFDDIANTIEALEKRTAANAKAIARGALPEPLLFRATNVAPGPPPTFQIEIVNPLTGASIAIGVI